MKKLSSSLLVVIALLLLFSLLIYADEITPDDSNDENVELPVVFVSDKGNDENLGNSAAKPFKTLNKAYEDISLTGGTVVICGKLSLVGENSTLPYHEKNIKITSYYEGVDYRQKNKAEIYIEDQLSILGAGSTEITEVKIRSAKSANIFCNGSDVTFGTGIDNYYESGTYPSIYGGIILSYENSLSDGDFSSYTITVKGGYWHHISGGNLRIDKYAPLSTISNVTVNIHGGTYVASDNDLYTTSALTGARAEGKVNFNIYGGTYYSSVYLLGNEGPLLPHVNTKNNAEVNFNISGGSFMGKYIKAIYSKNSSLFGTYNFNVDGGSFYKLNYVGCEGVQSEINLKSCDAIQNKLYGFEKVVYVSSEGDDNNSGENTYSTKKTLSGAISSLQSGGTVVVCSPMTLPKGFIMTMADKSITITSKYFDTDYAKQNDAMLTFEGDAYIQSSIRFKDITLKSNEKTNLYLLGNNNVFSKGITTIGDIALFLNYHESAHSLKIESGTYSLVNLGSSDVFTHFTFTGGSIDIFEGFRSVHKGSSLIELSGGKIHSDITLSDQLFEGDIELIIGKVDINGKIKLGNIADGKSKGALLTSDFSESNIEGFDIIKDKYIFVSDEGTGDGSTPANAAPDLNSIYTDLNGENAVVVICGKYTHKEEQSQDNVGVITYTSKYQSVDFSSLCDAMIVLDKDFVFKNDATVKDITLFTRYPHIAFRCQSHIVIFDRSVLVRSIYNSSEYYPDIIGSDTIALNSYDKDGNVLSDKITVSSGKWDDIYSSAVIEINGGYIFGSVFGSDSLTSHSNITVNNGVIYGGIYGSKYVTPSSSCDIIIKINGGEIHGIISPSLNESQNYKGKYKLYISQGNLTAVTEIIDGAFIGAEKSYAYISDNVVTDKIISNQHGYLNPISDKNSTVCLYKGTWYYFELSDNSISIHTSNSLASVKKSPQKFNIVCDENIYSINVSVNNGKIYLFASNITDNIEGVILYTFDENKDSNFNLISGSDDVSIVSPSIFGKEGEEYILYSSKEENGCYSIYISTFDEQKLISDDSTKIIEPKEKWEASTLLTPIAIKTPANNTIILYTGGDTNRSMIGMARLNDDDPLSFDSYEKSKDPIMYETESYKQLVLANVIDLDFAAEPYFLYYAKYNGEFVLMMQSYSFDLDDGVYLGEPCDINMMLTAFSYSYTLSHLLSGFSINEPEIQPSGSMIASIMIYIKDFVTKPEVLIAFLTLILSIILVIIIKAIKKRSNQYSKKLKKEQIKAAKRSKKRSKKLRKGKNYAKNLMLQEHVNSDADTSTDQDMDTIESTNDADIQTENDNSIINEPSDIQIISEEIQSDQLIKEKDSDTIESTSHDTSLENNTNDKGSEKVPVVASSEKRKHPRPTRRIK